MNNQQTQGMSMEELQPPYDDPSKQPKTLTRTRHIDNVLYVAGRAPIEGQIEYDVMFVSGAVEDDEATQTAKSSFGFRINQPAEYLKGQTGVIRDSALDVHLDIDKCYYTTVCKWLLPRTQRARPPVKILKWGMPILMDEIARVKPKIIVCMGKQPFDMLADQKIGFKSAHGCWFWSEKANAHLYCMHAPYSLIGKPDLYETFRVDFKEIMRRKTLLEEGLDFADDKINSQTINNMEDLKDWLDHLEEMEDNGTWPATHHRDDNDNPILSVDCEWHGRTHIDGQLRTMQIAWSEHDAVTIEFRDEQNNFTFNLGAQETCWAAEAADCTGYEAEDRAFIERVDEVFTQANLPPALFTADLSCLTSGEVNRNGDSYDWEGMRAALQEFVGKPCTPELMRSVKGKILVHMPHIEPPELLGFVDQENNSIAITGVAAGRQTGKSELQQAYTEAASATEAEAAQYKAVGKHIAGTFSRINARYLGHHYAADAPWMSHKLGIDIYQKCAMDTEFAQQTVDESSELGLERGIAMKYTSLGRYDYDLMMWKRDNKKLCEGGYGYIPSAIIHPYGIRDVIAPYRAYQPIKRQLQGQQLWEYYRDLFNPFVTDVFTEFTMTGLPMDIPLMDDLRHMFTFVTAKLNIHLQRRIHAEARNKLRNRIIETFGIMSLIDFTQPMDDRDEDRIREIAKRKLAEKEMLNEVSSWLSLIGHFIDSISFNIRSPDQMRRWLFDVEDLEPIKSTNQKAKGLPSMAWEKVIELPPERQKLYLPAVDKQTLLILSDKLPTIDELLNLNAVGNLSKAFLKEPSEVLNESTGEVELEEHGLHAWLTSEGRIAGQYSSTETGRPRSWAPNTLNWPSYVNRRIAMSVARVIREAHEEGDLPEELMKWVGKDADSLPSIRSCVKAPDGYVLVESDYATAEMVALSDIAGDDDLRRILREPDPDWVYLVKGNKYRAEAVRIGFSGVDATGIPAEAYNDEFIMHVWVAGENLGPVTDDMILRDELGQPQHAKYDIHWSLIERTYGLCREMMKAKVDRAAAKVLNFSSAYGASPASLERKIESDTGVKPEEGTGERGLEAIAARQPRATEFLLELAEIPKKVGWYRAKSGRIRHCMSHGSGSGIGWRTRNAVLSALGREMRNFPMQESVGATSARACRWLLSTYKRLNMKARPMTCLYDSVVTLCPLEERFLVSRLHQICMSDMNTWEYDDEHGKRTLQYTIDNEYNYRWSTSPTDAESAQLEDETWYPTPDRLQFYLKHENLQMFVS